MNRKALVWVCLTIGSFIGGLVPLIWGAGALSFSSLLFGALGSLAGIYIGYRLSRGY